jgi:hypothetical protein
VLIDEVLLRVLVAHMYDNGVRADEIEGTIPER